MSPAVHLKSRFASIAEATSESYARLNRISALRQPRWVDPEPLAWPRRLRQSWDFVLHGNRLKSGQGVRTHE